ncbi:hypothetical protein WJX82_002316 [Trebouxia sp. C0006]
MQSWAAGGILPGASSRTSFAANIFAAPLTQKAAWKSLQWQLVREALQNSANVKRLYRSSQMLPEGDQIQTDLQSLAIYERDGLTMNTALFDKALPGKPALVDAIVTAFQMPGAHRRANCCIWLRCGPKVHMFQLYNGYKLDVNGSSASVAAAWNWIPAPTSVVVGTTCLQTPVLQDGFVELLPHLVETSGMTEADPLMIEPRSAPMAF